jgi:hypothetical protein
VPGTPTLRARPLQFRTSSRDRGGVSAMPSLPNVSKVVRVDHHFTLGSDNNAQVRAFFQYTGALSQADAQTWVNAMATAWVNRMLPNQTSNLTLVSTTLTDLSGPSAAQASSTTGGAGSAAGGVTPAGTALVMKRRIGRRFRGGHPRMYIPAISGGQLATAQTWVAAFLTTITTAYGNYISDVLNNVPVAAAPATEVQVSYFQGFTNKTFPSGRTHPVPNIRAVPVVDLVLSHSANGKIASQRRRNLQSP